MLAGLGGWREGPAGLPVHPQELGAAVGQHHAGLLACTTLHPLTPVPVPVTRLASASNTSLLHFLQEMQLTGLLRPLQSLNLGGCHEPPHLARVFTPRLCTWPTSSGSGKYTWARAPYLPSPPLCPSCCSVSAPSPWTSSAWPSGWCRGRRANLEVVHLNMSSLQV